MFQTKRKLKAEIAQLKGELDSMTAAYSQLREQAGLVKKSGLPPCKGPYCYNCAHAAFAKSNGWGQWVLLGCGKDAPCGAYTPFRDSDPRAARRLPPDLQQQAVLSVNMEPKTAQHSAYDSQYKPDPQE